VQPSRRARWNAFLVYATVAIVLAVWTFPLMWVVVTSLKHRLDIFTVPPKILFKPTLSNYVFALTARPVLLNLRDSLIIATGATLITLAVAIPAGYAYARLRFPLRRQLSFLVLFMQMMPLLGLIVPFFLTLTWLRWTDTYHGLILVNLSVMIPTATWLMITFFQDLPSEMEEAAAIDGASRWQTFLQVMVPQTAGGAAVTATLAFLTAWNEFLFAVILSGSRVRPVTVGLYGFLQFEESLWGPLMATAVMAMAPVVVVSILAQRHLIRGLTLGAMK
jgi:ABC-type glycerol-3-phosphate transport system permease component